MVSPAAPHCSSSDPEGPWVGVQTNRFSWQSEGPNISGIPQRFLFLKPHPVCVRVCVGEIEI